MTNLHAIWDTGLVVQTFGRSEADAEAHLRPMVVANGARSSRGSVDDWAAEAHQIAVTVVYGKRAVAPGCNQNVGVQTISPAYEVVAMPVVRQQLTKAGARLATVLNGAL